MALSYWAQKRLIKNAKVFERQPKNSQPAPKQAVRLPGLQIMLCKTTGTIAKRDDDGTVHQGSCAVKKFDDNKLTDDDDNQGTVEVFNPYNKEIPANTWIFAIFWSGEWFALTGDCTAEDE